MDDPFSTVAEPNGVNATPSGDTMTYTGFEAVNQSGHTEADVGVWLPFVEVPFALSNGKEGHEALTWDSSQGGWFTPNFINPSGQATGESLLITAQIDSSPTTLAAGNVANASGHEQYPLSSSDFLKGPDWSPEAIQTSDLLPFSDIGSINPGPSNAVPFDIAFTAHWGGADMGAVRVGGYVATLAPDNGKQGGSPTMFSGLATNG